MPSYENARQALANAAHNLNYGAESISKDWRMLLGPPVRYMVTEDSDITHTLCGVVAFPVGPLSRLVRRPRIVATAESLFIGESFDNVLLSVFLGGESERDAVESACKSNGIGIRVGSSSDAYYYRRLIKSPMSPVNY